MLRPDYVNVLVHGQRAPLSEMIAIAAQDSELIEYAKTKGANGILLAGLCCTASEILMCHGMPVTGNYLQQELAIVTSCVDAVIVIVQCIMENIANVAKCYHTEIITTDHRVMIESGDVHHM